MLVELWRSTDGLAGVVDDVVEAISGLKEVSTKSFDARGVTQI